MKITEMKKCIEKMRECYKFDDDKAEIRFGDSSGYGSSRIVRVCINSENGTRIEMTRSTDELVEK